MRPLLPLLFAACSGGTPTPADVAPAPTQDAGPADARAAGGGEPDASTPDAAADEPLAAFGALDTVAGRGGEDEKGVNGWLPAFEGGPATAAELSRPHMAQADAAGRIYVADKDAHGIRVVEPDGTIRTLAGTNAPGDGPDGDPEGCAMRSPNGLFVTPEGAVYVLDLGNGKVRVVRDGRVTTLFADPRGFGAGRGLWVDGEVVYYAASTEVRRWSPDGGVTPLAGGFVDLGNLALDGESLLVSDRGGGRVWRVARDGTKSLATERSFDEPRAVWPWGGGFFVGTHAGSRVWYVDADGEARLFLDGEKGDSVHGGDGEPWDAPGKKVSEVRSVAVAPDGAVLVVENDRGFVRRISPSR